MLEAILVFGAVAALALVGLVGPLIGATALLVGGAACTGLGLAVGVPTGFWYHVRLRACLAARDELPPRWWVRPVALHPRLLDHERLGVLRWFYVGGLGFLMTVLGCALVVVGVSLEALRATS